MNKILIEDHFLPYLIDEEIYVVDEKFKQQVVENKEHLGSIEEDTTNVALPIMVNELLVIVLFNDNQEQIGSYKSFLNKLLAAAGFKLSKVDVFVMNKYKDTKAKTVIEHSNAKYVMAFGVDLKNPEKFQLRQFSGKQILIAGPLENLPTNKELKAKLWGLMKEMFKLE